MYTIRHFSQALFDCGKDAKNLDKLLMDFELAKNKINNEKALKLMLSNPEIIFEEKAKILEFSLGNRVSAEVFNVIFLLIQKNLLNSLESVFYNFKKLVLENDKKLEAIVISAMPLGKRERAEIVSLLEKKTGKKVNFIEKIDRRVLGGVIVKIGDEMIDLSLRGRLEAMKDHLA